MFHTGDGTLVDALCNSSHLEAEEGHVVVEGWVGYTANSRQFTILIYVFRQAGYAAICHVCSQKPYVTKANNQ